MPWPYPVFIVGAIIVLPRAAAMSARMPACGSVDPSESAAWPRSPVSGPTRKYPDALDASPASCLSTPGSRRPDNDALAHGGTPRQLAAAERQPHLRFQIGHGGHGVRHGSALSLWGVERRDEPVGDDGLRDLSGHVVVLNQPAHQRGDARATVVVRRLDAGSAGRQKRPAPSQRRARRRGQTACKPPRARMDARPAPVRGRRAPSTNRSSAMAAGRPAARSTQRCVAC